jgi:hypothetical protein
VNRHARNSENNMTTMLGWRHSNVIDDLMEKIAKKT